MQRKRTDSKAEHHEQRNSAMETLPYLRTWLFSIRNPNHKTAMIVLIRQPK